MLAHKATREAKVAVEASMVELIIEAPYPIRQAPGALALSGKTATYRWPLTRVLTLSAPIRIRLVF